jgi:hypothetical protein
VNAVGDEPLQAYICAGFGIDSGNCGAAPGSFTVPSTTSDGLTVKRLVIQNVSSYCTTVGSVSGLGVSLLATMNENTVTFDFGTQLYLPLVASSPGSKVLANSVAATAYADPGSTVSANFFSGSFSSGSGAQCTLTVSCNLVTR